MSSILLRGSGFRVQELQPRFAVFYGEDQPGGEFPNPQTHLVEFFERWFVPRYALLHKHRRWERTLKETRTWVLKFCGLMGDLPLGRITLADCDQFYTWALMLPQNLYRGPSYAVQRAARKPGAPKIIRRYRSWQPSDEDLAPRTVEKGLTALQAVLDASGPRSRKHQHTAAIDGLFGLDQYSRPRSAPWFPDVPGEQAGFATSIFTLEEVSAILRATVHARQPHVPGMAPADWWHALVLFLYNTGVRIGTALALRWSMLKQNLFGDAFLEVPGYADKKGKPRLDVLNSHALAAIGSTAAARAAATESDPLIFPQPYGREHLLDLLREIEQHAGLPAERRFGFHAFRKANITETWRLSEEAAQGNAGHGDRRTTIDHYVAAEALAHAKVLRELPALERLPQPG